MKLAPFLQRSHSKRDLVPPPKPRRPGQYSIGTILVVMAMFAVALAAFQSSLGAGIGFLVLVLASLVRTAIVEALRARDRSMSASTSVVSELFMSVPVPITMLAVAAGSVVFWVGCLVALALAMNNGRPVANLPIWPVGAGVILGSVAAGFLLWITRNAARDI